MMISKQMNARLCGQVANEMAASYSYLGMACALERMGLKMFSAFFLKQSEEERGHALRIVKYVQDVGGDVSLAAIPAAATDYSTVTSIVEAALASELTVTKQVNDLMALAEQESDYATRSMLNWFVKEQVEEVSSMTELLQLLKLAGEEKAFFVESRLVHDTDKSK